MNLGILVSRLPTDSIGGAQTQACRVAAQLSQRHQVTIFTRSPRTRLEGGRQGACTVYRRNAVDIPVVRFGADLISTVWLLGVWRSKIDIILAYQTFIDGVIAVTAKRLFRTPAVVSVQSEDEYKIRDSWKSRLLSPLVFRQANRILVQSQRLKESLLAEVRKSLQREQWKEIERKVAVVPNGVSAPLARQPEGTTILYVGRLVPVKGVEQLITAMNQCPEEKLLIVGDGPERNRLERVVKDMGNVEFVGSVAPEDVSAYMQKAKLLVLPSLKGEGSPNVVLEAMAHGVPTIATRIAGVPDLIDHGQTGLLVEPGDVASLAECIKWLSGDEQMRMRLATNCRSEVKKYAWSEVLPVLENTLRSCLQAKP